jgi:hypothetical protein
MIIRVSSGVKNFSLRRFLFRLRSRFSFHYAYCKSSFNLLLEIFSAKHPVRLGGLPDSLKQLWLDVHPKQLLARQSARLFN